MSNSVTVSFEVLKRCKTVSNNVKWCEERAVIISVLTRCQRVKSAKQRKGARQCKTVSNSVTVHGTVSAYLVKKVVLLPHFRLGSEYSLVPYFDGARKL